MSSREPPKEYQAVVEKVINGGHHGPYAWATIEQLGLVTFSLKPDVWAEESQPDPGTIVILSKIRKKRAGWRAEGARFFGPQDEPLVNGSTA